MKNAQVLRLYDLIHEIKKTDELIKMHRSLTDDPFVTDQYVALKDNLFAQVISELASPPLASATSYLIVQTLVERFYPEETVKSLNQPLLTELTELRQLAQAA